MKKILLIIGLPILMIYICGVYGFADFLFFLKLDYSDPIVQYTVNIILLLGLLQSAFIKFMIWQHEKRKNRNGKR